MPGCFNLVYTVSSKHNCFLLITSFSLLICLSYFCFLLLPLKLAGFYSNSQPRPLCLSVLHNGTKKDGREICPWQKLRASYVQEKKHLSNMRIAFIGDSRTRYIFQHLIHAVALNSTESQEHRTYPHTKGNYSYFFPRPNISLPKNNLKSPLLCGAHLLLFVVWMMLRFRQQLFENVASSYLPVFTGTARVMTKTKEYFWCTYPDNCMTDRIKPWLDNSSVAPHYLIMGVGAWTATDIAENGVHIGSLREVLDGFAVPANPDMENRKREHHVLDKVRNTAAAVINRSQVKLWSSAFSEAAAHISHFHDFYHFKGPLLDKVVCQLIGSMNPGNC